MAISSASAPIPRRSIFTKRLTKRTATPCGRWRWRRRVTTRIRSSITIWCGNGTDAKTGLLANREEREKFEGLAHKVLTDVPVDLPALIARTKAAPSIYKSIEGERIPAVIEVDNDSSDTRTIIDLEAEDRVGLLYDVSRALADLELDLSLAKILTEKGAAVDSFYATEQDGGKILDSERIKAVKTKLRQAVLRSAPLPSHGR